MKKILYGTTALVAAGMLASGSAAAADKVKMGVGGYFQAFFVVADQDDSTGEPGANRRNHGVSREGEIIDHGVAQGIIEKAGSWYSYGTDRIGQGKENVRAYLKANPEIAADIEAQIRAKLLPDSKEADKAADKAETVAQEA